MGGRLFVCQPGHRSIFSVFPDWLVTRNNGFAEENQAANRLTCRVTPKGESTNTGKDLQRARVQGAVVVELSRGQAGPLSFVAPDIVAFRSMIRLGRGGRSCDLQRRT